MRAVLPPIPADSKTERKPYSARRVVVRKVRTPSRKKVCTENGFWGLTEDVAEAEDEARHVGEHRETEDKGEEVDEVGEKAFAGAQVDENKTEEDKDEGGWTGDAAGDQVVRIRGEQSVDSGADPTDVAGDDQRGEDDDECAEKAGGDDGVS